MNARKMVIGAVVGLAFVIAGVVGVFGLSREGSASAATKDANTAVVSGAVQVQGTEAVTGWPQVNIGKTYLSRDSWPECCYVDASLAIAENTASTGRIASISFHNGNYAEGVLELAPNREVGGSRRLRIYDHQGQGMGLEMTGGLFVNNGVSEFRGRGLTYIDLSDVTYDPNKDYDGRFLVTPTKFNIMSGSGKDICIGYCDYN